MTIKHKLEYGVTILVSLLLVFALQHTIMTYAVNDENAYVSRWRSSGESYTTMDLEMIQELQTSIKDNQEYFFYVNEDQEKEYASIASILKDHAFGFRIADAGLVKYLEVDEPILVKFMASSQSNHTIDKIHFSIETVDGDTVYQYEGINESYQEIVEIGPGHYFINWGAVANESNFKVTMKLELNR